MYVGRGDGEMTIILDEKREMNVNNLFTMYIDANKKESHSKEKTHQCVALAK